MSGLELGNVVLKSLKAYPGSAIHDNNQSFSYNDLLANIHEKAEELQSIQTTGKVNVCLSLPKSIESLAYYLAVLHLNWTIIPIDSASPSSRTSFIIEQSKAQLYIGESLPDDLSDKFETTKSSIIFRRKEHFRDDIPADCRLVLFTSGSTGDPKGVMHSSQSILPFVNWSCEEFQINEKDRVLSISPFHFDLSVFDIFVSIFSGADLILANASQTITPSEIQLLFQKHQPTVVYATPSWYKLQMKFEGINESTAPRLVLFAGEVFHPVDLHQLKDTWPSSDYYNLYGPTETNVCTYQKIVFDMEREVPYPIGFDCPYSTSVIDPETKELLVSSTTQMMGYVAGSNSLISRSNKLFYPTGDAVTFDENNRMMYSGRLDRMMKRNGFRIEPTEIEKAIKKIPEVQNCFVFSSDDKLICAYEGEIEMSQVQFKIKIKSLLPIFMLPDSFVYLTEFPLNSNSKIDTEKIIKVCQKK